MNSKYLGLRPERIPGASRRGPGACARISLVEPSLSTSAASAAVKAIEVRIETRGEVGGAASWAPSGRAGSDRGPAGERAGLFWHARLTTGVAGHVVPGRGAAAPGVSRWPLRRQGGGLRPC